MVGGNRDRNGRAQGIERPDDVLLDRRAGTGSDIAHDFSNPPTPMPGGEGVYPDGFFTEVLFERVPAHVGPPPPPGVPRMGMDLRAGVARGSEVTSGWWEPGGARGSTRASGRLHGRHQQLGTVRPGAESHISGRRQCEYTPHMPTAAKVTQCKQFHSPTSSQRGADTQRRVFRGSLEF